MEPGDQSSGSDSYVGVTGIRSYDGRHRKPRVTLYSSPEGSLPPTPAPRRGSVDTVNFYDLESGEAFSADRTRNGNWFVRKWDQATQGWPDLKSRTTLRFLAAVGPELLAATGKAVQAAGYDKIGKAVTATGAVARGAVDSKSAYDAWEWNKAFTAGGGMIGAVAQYPITPNAQGPLEAVALTASAMGRAAAQWPPTAPEPPFSTNYPLNTQIASYANASPDSMSPTPETPIGGGSSGSEFDPRPPIRRRTTHRDAAAVQGMTSMLPTGHREHPRPPREEAPPLARTSSMQVPPAGRNQSGGRKGPG